MECWGTSRGKYSEMHGHPKQVQFRVLNPESVGHAPLTNSSAAGRIPLNKIVLRLKREQKVFGNHSEHT